MGKGTEESGEGEDVGYTEEEIGESVAELIESELPLALKKKSEAAAPSAD